VVRLAGSAGENHFAIVPGMALVGSLFRLNFQALDFGCIWTSTISDRWNFLAVLSLTPSCYGQPDIDCGHHSLL
jgi:hypothetical protein